MYYIKILFCLLGVACFSKVDMSVSAQYLDNVFALELDQNQTLLEQIESSMRNVDNNTQIHIDINGSHLSDSALRSLLKRAGMSTAFCQDRKGLDKGKRMDSLSTTPVKLRDMFMSVIPGKSDSISDSSNVVSSIFNFYFSQSNNSVRVKGKNQQSKMSDTEFAEYIFNTLKDLQVKNVTKVTLKNFGKSANSAIDIMNKFFMDLYSSSFNIGLESISKSDKSISFIPEKGKIQYKSLSHSSTQKDIPQIQDSEDIERLISFDAPERKIEHLEKYEAALEIKAKTDTVSLQARIFTDYQSY